MLFSRRRFFSRFSCPSSLSEVSPIASSEEMKHVNSEDDHDEEEDDDHRGDDIKNWKRSSEVSVEFLFSAFHSASVGGGGPAPFGIMTTPSFMS